MTDHGRVVVTGAAGNFGQEVVARLIATGTDVRATVLHDSELDGRWPDMVAVDLTDAAATDAVMAGARAVVHLAALPSPGHGAPHVVFANNTLATFNVMQAARRHGVTRAVVASSVSIYGMSFALAPFSPACVPVVEDEPKLPQDSYGLSKLVDESTVESVVRAAAAEGTTMSAVLLRLHWIATRELQLRRVAEEADKARIGVRELWGYVDIDDAVTVVERALSAPFTGVHAVNVAASDTTSSTPTADLLARHHPRSRVRAPLSGFQSAWSSDACAALLGVRPTRSWRDAV